MGYLIALLLFISLYILGIVFLKRLKENKICNIGIPIFIFVLYLYCLITILIKCGMYDWNFTNALPTANVSPFMYCGCFILIFLPKSVRKYGNTLISFLSLGMLFAGVFSLIYNVMRDYNFYLHFVVDSFIHILLSWYGIYLYKTKQVFFEKKKRVFSSAVIVSVAVIMLVLNVIFDQSFFGLSLNRKHNIYSVVLCDDSNLSAIIYFSGLIFVLLIGSLYQKFLSRKLYKN